MDVLFSCCFFRISWGGLRFRNLVPRLRLQIDQIRHNCDYVKFTKEKLSFINSYSKYP